MGEFRAGQVFPLRLLGFGLYWTWLFLVGVSPSPVFGHVEFAGAPFELPELFLRLVFVVVLLALGTRVTSDIWRQILLVVCAAGGVAAVLLLKSAELAGGGVLLVALVDALLFVLWLCFFGAMRVGETAVYMALSYAIGGLVCLATANMSQDLKVLISAFLPAASVVSFVLSWRLYSESGSMSRSRQADEVRLRDSDDRGMFPYLVRLTVALGLYAVLLGLLYSLLFQGAVQVRLPGSLIEALCCLPLGIGYAIILRLKRFQNAYVLYKVVPLLFAFGFVLLVIDGQAGSFLAGLLIMLAYLMFEVSALNDFCNAAKQRNVSLVRMFCYARCGTTLGLIAGWSIGLFVLPALVWAGALAHVALVLAFIVVVLTATIVFTDRELFVMHGVAEDQAHYEQLTTQSQPDCVQHDELVEQFAGSFHLSNREMEVLELLLKGRNVAYIAERLFIAPGTVKTHIHNIYTKLDIHTKMELFDIFEAFTARRK